MGQITSLPNFLKKRVKLGLRKILVWPTFLHLFLLWVFDCSKTTTILFLLQHLFHIQHPSSISQQLSIEWLLCTYLLSMFFELLLYLGIGDMAVNKTHKITCLVELSGRGRQQNKCTNKKMLGKCVAENWNIWRLGGYFWLGGYFHVKWPFRGGDIYTEI